MLARDLMSGDVRTISPDATVGDAARLMLEHNVSCLPVVNDENRLVGILTHTDFGLHPRFVPLADNVYTLLGSATTPAHVAEVAQTVSRLLIKDVMHRPVTTVAEDDSSVDVVQLMLRRGIHRVPVMRGQDLVGIITRHDFLKLFSQP